MLVALAFAPTALAQTYDLVEADNRAQVAPDGGVLIEEDITVAFSGGFQFTYGFREIPYRRDERISGISVLENGRPFSP
ncbi:MAG: hypothetical protein WD015_02085, partial [Gaiellaceae bacterium]